MMTVALKPSPTTTNIPICPVQLAPWQTATSYFNLIEEKHIYANQGPCVPLFEKRLANHFQVPESSILAVCNGTAALQIALLAIKLKNKRYCLMPAWTFVASAAAAAACGLEPLFIDVDPITWAITPDIVKETLGYYGDQIACIMPVSPFGYPLNAKEWDNLTEETGIPVLIDAAACFVAPRFGKTPLMISLHATKVFGIGEGGILATLSPHLYEHLKQLRNFGIDNARNALNIGLNAKLSEYAAAIGLGQLDAWDERHQSLMSLSSHYAQLLKTIPGVYVQPGYGENWFSSTCVISFDQPIAHEVAEIMAKHGIETRFWWKSGCHTHPAYNHYRQLSLNVTNTLANSTLGLPFGITLTLSDVTYIIDVIRLALRGG